MKIIFFFALFVIHLALIAQPIDQQLDEAEALINTSKYKPSKLLLYKLFKQPHTLSPLQKNRLYSLMTDNYLFLDESDSIQKYIHLSLHLAKKKQHYYYLATSHRQFAQLGAMGGNLEPLNMHVNQALQICDQHGNTSLKWEKLRINLYLFKCYYFRGPAGRIDESKQYAEKALNKCNELLDDHDALTLDAASHLASVISDMGNFKEAYTYIKKAHQLAKQYHPNQYILISIKYKLSQIYYFMNNQEMAIQTSLELMEVSDHIFGKPTYLSTITCGNISLYYSVINNQDKALYYAELAKEKYETRNGFEKNLNYLISSSQLASIYSELGQFDRALHLAHQILGYIKAMAKESEPVASDIYYFLSQIYFRKGEIKKALACADTAVICELPALIGQNDWTPTLQRLSGNHNKYRILALLKSKHKLASTHFDQTKDPWALSQSYFSGKYIIALMENTRKNLSHSSKQRIQKSTHIVYENAMKAALHLFQLNDDQQFLAEAFRYSEQSKSIAFREHIQQKLAQYHSFIPPQIIQSEHELNKKISQLAHQISITPDSSKLPLEAHLIRLREKLDSIHAIFQSKYPQYAQIMGEETLRNHYELQQQLSADQSIVSYFIGENIFIGFCVQQDTIHYIMNDKPKRLTYLIDTLRRQLKVDQINSNMEAAYLNYLDHGYELYEHLLKPFEALLTDKKNLIIVPHGKLAYIPIEVLPTQPVQSPINPTDINYVLHHYSISYINIASFIKQKSYQQPSQSSPNVLAFAPTYKDGQLPEQSMAYGVFRNAITPLPYNKLEIENISQWFPVQIFEEDASTEAQFKSDAQNYDIIHLAMHAFVDDENALNSKFLFQERADNKEDNLLHAYELQHLDIGAELVVLSACHSGYGKLQLGEGVMSLARAFEFGGAKSVLMSHWVVEDETSSKIMNLFYKYLADGHPKHEALRLAKLDFLKTASPIEAHPFFWGTFVLMGNTTPVTTSQLNFWLMLGGIIFIVLFLTWFIVKRKSRI